MVSNRLSTRCPRRFLPRDQAPRCGGEWDPQVRTLKDRVDGIAEFAGRGLGAMNARGELVVDAALVADRAGRIENQCGRHTFDRKLVGQLGPLILQQRVGEFRVLGEFGHGRGVVVRHGIDRDENDPVTGVPVMEVLQAQGVASAGRATVREKK